MSWRAEGPVLSRPNWMSFGLLAAYLLVPEAWTSCAQMNMSCHTMGTEDQTPPDKLPVPQKMTGIGTVHMQITAMAEAQMWFNQGLNLLHDYWDYESARAFEQGIRVDPQCVMCYWGLYEAESFFHGTAQAYAGRALDKAASLKRHVSKRERLYIEATAAREDAVKNARAASDPPRELQLWRKLVKKYPNDLEARIFLAQDTDHKESLAILRSVLKEDPENSAANHYYIHELEASEHPEQALHSAEILASLAPASGHMVHMPGHIFFRMGDYARAEQAFAASMQVDERYMRGQHVQPDFDWNYVHNLMYAIANLMEEGKPKRSYRAFHEACRGARRTGAHLLHLFGARFDFAARSPLAGGVANGRLGAGSGINEGARTTGKVAEP
jgi:tetratricopeptide (TPR) repeat protein